MNQAQLAAQKLLKDLNLENLSQRQRQEVLQKITAFFNEVIMSVMLKRLSEDQFEDFKQAVKIADPQAQEAAIAKIAMQVPGLWEDINERIEQEYRIMKTVMTSPKNDKQKSS